MIRQSESASGVLLRVGRTCVSGTRWLLGHDQGLDLVYYLASPAPDHEAEETGDRDGDQEADDQRFSIGEIDKKVLAGDGYYLVHLSLAGSFRCN